jgi:hypothetical protein
MRMPARTLRPVDQGNAWTGLFPIHPGLEAQPLEPGDDIMATEAWPPSIRVFFRP